MRIGKNSHIVILNVDSQTKSILWMHGKILRSLNNSQGLRCDSAIAKAIVTQAHVIRFFMATFYY